MLEQSAEQERMEDNLALLVSSRRVFLDMLTNLTCADPAASLDTALLHHETNVALAAAAGVDVVSRDFTVTWDYLQSVFFASTILTTIGQFLLCTVSQLTKITLVLFLGYGNIAPVTMSGRIFCLLFAIIGIPFTLSVVADVGGIFASLVSKLWTAYGSRAKAMFERYKRLRRSNAEEEDEEDEDWISGHLVTAFLALLLLSLFLSLGAGIFLLFEDWTFLDSFYFCFITMTTIGFGDLTPDLPHNSSSYMLLCTVYIFIGMSLTSTIIELVRRQYAESWRKMVELRAQIQAQLKMAATLKKIAEHAGLNISTTYFCPHRCHSSYCFVIEKYEETRPA